MLSQAWIPFLRCENKVETVVNAKVGSAASQKRGIFAAGGIGCRECGEGLAILIVEGWVKTGDTRDCWITVLLACHQSA